MWEQGGIEMISLGYGEPIFAVYFMPQVLQTIEYLSGVVVSAMLSWNVGLFLDGIMNLGPLHCRQ